MPDLNGKIAEWRRQMLAAGIETPVPLNELESHLREPVKHQMRSLLGQQHTFDLAGLRLSRWTGDGCVSVDTAPDGNRRHYFLLTGGSHPPQNRDGWLPWCAYAHVPLEHRTWMGNLPQSCGFPRARSVSLGHFGCVCHAKA